jgi:hypothetical protein
MRSLEDAHIPSLGIGGALRIEVIEELWGSAEGSHLSLQRNTFSGFVQIVPDSPGRTICLIAGPSRKWVIDQAKVEDFGQFPGRNSNPRMGQVM